MNDQKCREFIEKLLKDLWAARTEAEENSGVFPGTKVKQARAEASTAQWFANKLGSANIKYSKMQPKDLPDAGAHVERSGGVNTIWLDPHGAGGDRSLDLIHETFHIDPPGFSDIDIANTFMKTAKSASEASASSWWSHHVDDNCGGQKKQ